MALTSTTLSVACAEKDPTVTLTSVTSLVAGMIVKVNDEEMLVKEVVNYKATVQRGVNKTLARAHGILSIAVFGYSYDFAVTPKVKHYYTYGANGALTKAPGVHVLAKATAGTYTLAAPTADDEGMQLLLITSTAAAHTLTLDSGTFNNETHSEVLVFAAAIGNCIELIVNGGYWCVMINKNVTLPSVSASVSNSVSASVSASVSNSVSGSSSASVSPSVSSSVSASVSNSLSASVSASTSSSVSASVSNSASGSVSASVSDSSSASSSVSDSTSSSVSQSVSNSLSESVSQSVSNSLSESVSDSISASST